MRKLLFASALALSACGGVESEDPCGQLVSCMYEVIVGCADPAFGDDCAELSMGAACGALTRACEEAE